MAMTARLVLVVFASVSILAAASGNLFGSQYLRYPQMPLLLRARRARNMEQRAILTYLPIMQRYASERDRDPSNDDRQSYDNYFGYRHGYLPIQPMPVPMLEQLDQLNLPMKELAEIPYRPAEVEDNRYYYGPYRELEELPPEDFSYEFPKKDPQQNRGFAVTPSDTRYYQQPAPESYQEEDIDDKAYQDSEEVVPNNYIPLSNLMPTFRRDEEAQPIEVGDKVAEAAITTKEQESIENAGSQIDNEKLSVGEHISVSDGGDAESDAREKKKLVVEDFEEPRKLRQNPNLAVSKLKNFVIDGDLDKNTNLYTSIRLAKQPRVDDIPSSLVPSSQQRHVHVVQRALGRNGDGQRSLGVYTVALVAGIAAAIAVGIIGFALGWYTLRKRAKAAADVEYPAYGVTGPNTEVSPSGDRRLAHSAQLYHYQHQKQQIIATERNSGERNGSISDPESEDENEEGDYTVYECPGFATTGEMEVKNPLFSDDPTPASQKSVNTSASVNGQSIQVTVPAPAVRAPPPTVIITNKK